MSYDIEQVRRIAAEVRSFLEARWPDVHEANGIVVPEGVPASHEMCRLSTAFLKAVLEQEIPDVEWLWVGGSPDEKDEIDFDMKFPGGYLAQSGEWAGHYWVTDGDFDLIVDVTADQFGGEVVTVKTSPTVIQSPGLPPFEYRENYIPDAVDRHMDGVRGRVGRWLKEWEQDHAPGWSSEPALPVPA